MQLSAFFITGTQQTTLKSRKINASLVILATLTEKFSRPFIPVIETAFSAINLLIVYLCCSTIRFFQTLLTFLYALIEYQTLFFLTADIK